MLKRLHGLWLWILKWLTVTRPARLAVIMVAAVLVFLIFSEQGQDVVRALAEREASGQDAWQRFFFFGGMLAWSACAWYWARQMLRLEFPGVPGNEPQYFFYRTWMPRVLARSPRSGCPSRLPSPRRATRRTSTARCASCW